MTTEQPTPDPQAYIDGLRQITSNIARYVEEQAQLIARPKIAAAERAWEVRSDEKAEVHAAREQRSADLIAELRRRVQALESWQERAHLRETRVRGAADYLDTHEMRAAATTVRNALNGVGHMRTGATR
jgi:hypothetical protein